MYLLDVHPNHVGQEENSTESRYSQLQIPFRFLKYSSPAAIHISAYLAATCDQESTAHSSQEPRTAEIISEIHLHFGLSRLHSEIEGLDASVTLRHGDKKKQ